MKKSTFKSDALLLRKIKNGDTAATRTLVEQYLNRIVNYGTRMLGDHSEAEDVAQEAFLRLWLNLDPCNRLKYRKGLIKLSKNYPSANGR